MVLKNTFTRAGALCLIVIGLVISLSGGLHAQAANSALDPSFGNGGLVTRSLVDTFTGDMRAALRLSSGAIAIAGTIRNNDYPLMYHQDQNFALERLTAAGDMDPSFGRNGSLITRIRNGMDIATALAEQADGKLVVAGSSTDLTNAEGHADFTLARYNIDGSLDTSFGDDGIVITDFQFFGRVDALAIQANNKIVVAGLSHSANGALNFTIIRYNSDGTLDATFGTNGIKLIPGGYEFAVGGALHIAANGKILFTATTHICEPMCREKIALLRLLPNGNLDSSFGTAGVVLGPENRLSRARSLAVLPDGSILVAGSVTPPCADCYDFNFGVVKYTSAGVLDTAFGDAGVALADFNGEGDSIKKIVVRPDGRIVALGAVAYSTSVLLAGFTAAGDLDPAFGDDGKLILATDTAPVDLIMLPGSAPQFLVIDLVKISRLNNDGTLDTTFGANGAKKHYLTLPTDEEVQSVVVQADGKILAAGGSHGYAESERNIILTRYNQDGSPDSSFGTGGLVFTASPMPQGIGVARMVVQDDGKILLAGTLGYEDSIIVLRYNSDGSPDLSFGGSGYVVSRNQSLNRAAALAVQPDGKIVVVGMAAYYVRATPIRGGQIIRYNADGSLDTTLGDAGSLVFPEAQLAVLTDVAILPDAKILMIGERSIHRYNNDGSPDTSFGNNGRREFSTDPAGSWFYGQDLLLLPDGKFIVVGDAYIQSYQPQQYSNLERYNADGTIDTSFGADGFVRFGAGQATNVVSQPDGKLVVRHQIPATANTPEFVELSRFTPDGAADTEFGTDGSLKLYELMYGAGLAQQADGKHIVGGGSPGNDITLDYTLARVLPSAPPTPTTGPGCIFSDVCQSDFFYEPVDYLVDRGVISGYANDTFRPYNNVTRGQLAKIVVLAEGWKLVSPTAPTFSDVGPSNPFYREIETAYAHGIISGYAVPGGSEYRWGNDATRGQIAKIIVAAEGWAADTTGAPHFSDVTSANPFYEAIETAYNKGIISGYDDGTFRWANNATRGQIAKIVFGAVTAP